MPRSSGDTTQDSGSAFDEDTDRNEQQQTTKLNNSIESENTSMVKSQQVPNISGCVVSNDSCMSKLGNSNKNSVSDFRYNLDSGPRVAGLSLRVDIMKNRVWNSYLCNWKTGPKKRFFRMTIFDFFRYF